MKATIYCSSFPSLVFFLFSEEELYLTRAIEEAEVRTSKSPFDSLKYCFMTSYLSQQIITMRMVNSTASDNERRMLY